MTEQPNREASGATPAAGATVQIAEPGERLAFTGERYTTGVPGDIQNEHYHRYLFALRLCRDMDVLDIASGEGYGAALLAGVATSVIGVDIDEDSVTFATRAYLRENLSFRTGSALAIPLDDHSVDAITSFETLEHLVDHATFMAEVRRVLRPGGIFIVSTPDTKVYSHGGYRNPFHLSELNRDEFATLLRKHFPQLRLFEQQVLAGSVIAAIGDTGGITESFATTDGKSFKHESCLPRAPYLVAIASAEPLHLPQVSLLHGLWTDTGAASGPAKSAETMVPAATAPSPLRAEVTELRRRLLDATLKLSELNRRVLEMDRERGFLRAMLTSARRLANTTRADLVHARMEFERGEVKSSAAHAQAEAERDAILRSTSWRLTGPLRRALNFARRVLR